MRIIKDVKWKHTHTHTHETQIHTYKQKHLYIVILIATKVESFKLESIVATIAQKQTGSQLPKDEAIGSLFD